MQKTIVRELKVYSTFVIQFRVFNITVVIGIKLALSLAPRLTFSPRQGKDHDTDFADPPRTNLLRKPL